MNHFEELLTRLERDGPVRMRVTEEEYEQLQRVAKALWEGNLPWNQQTRRLFLAFLRGYTLYRELPEDEGQFWSDFLTELEVNPQQTSNKLYDQLEEVLKSHPEVKSSFKVSQGPNRQRREFVRTIHAVWGLQKLPVGKLIELFLNFHQKRSGGENFSQTIKRTHPAEHAIYDAYSPVMTALLPAVQYILEHNLETLELEPLVQRLEEAGLDLGQPNCVRFLANKSEHALPEIIRRLRELARVNTPTTQGERERQSSNKELKREDVRLRLRKLQGANFGEDELIWRLSSNHRLIEGQTQSGFVQLPDGRFSTFTWKPLRNKDGSEGRVVVSVQIDEIEIEAELECSPFAVRWYLHKTPLSAAYATQLEGLKAHLLTPYKKADEWRLRYSVASNPAQLVENLEELRPRARDLLLVEVCVNSKTGVWLPLSRLPLQIAPVLDSAKIHDGLCVVAMSRPQKALLTIQELEPKSGYQVMHEHQISANEPLLVRLRHPQRLSPTIIKLILEADGLKSEATVHANPSISLERALIRGLGWSAR